MDCSCSTCDLVEAAKVEALWEQLLLLDEALCQDLSPEKALGQSEDLKDIEWPEEVEESAKASGCVDGQLCN